MTSKQFTKTVSDVGEITGSYQAVFAALYRNLFAVSNVTENSFSVLCGPTAKIPVLPILERRTSWRSLTLFDPRSESVEAQASKIDDVSRVQMIRADLSYMARAKADRTYDLVFDPFGLQENLDSFYKNVGFVSRLLKRGGLFISASWGEVSYPSILERLPGILEDREFSDKNLTPRIVSNELELVKEHTIKFYVKHTKSQILKLIPIEKVGELELYSSLKDEAYKISSCVYLRVYQENGK